MSVIYWIIVGGVAGWLASMVMGKNEQMGVVANVAVGIVGALLGGWVFGSYVWGDGTGFWRDLIISVIGAVILLFLYSLFAGRGGSKGAAS